MAEAKLKLHLARVTQTAAQTKADEAAKTVNEKKEAAEKATKDLEEARDNTWRARLSAGHVALGQLPAALKVLFDFVVGLFQ